MIISFLRCPCLKCHQVSVKLPKGVIQFLISPKEGLKETKAYKKGRNIQKIKWQECVIETFSSFTPHLAIDNKFADSTYIFSSQTRTQGTFVANHIKINIQTFLSKEKENLWQPLKLDISRGLIGRVAYKRFWVRWAW